MKLKGKISSFFFFTLPLQFFIVFIYCYLCWVSRGQHIINFSSLKNLFFFLFFFWQCGMWGLIPWLGIESMSPAMTVQSPNQWTTEADPWKSLLSPEAHPNIHIHIHMKHGYSGLFLHIPLSMTGWWEGSVPAVRDLYLYLLLTIDTLFRSQYPNVKKKKT